MITNEMLLTVAKHDGWEVVGVPFFEPPYKILAKQTPTITKEIPYISPSGKEYDDWARELKYATSLDWLHPVALKLLDELRKCRKEHHQFYIGEIRHDMFFEPINGQYIDLFNAVHEAILFINKSKLCNNN